MRPVREHPMRRASRPPGLTAMFAALAMVLGCDGARAAGSPATVVRDSAGIEIVESGAPSSTRGDDSAPLRVDSVPTLSIGVEAGEEVYQLHRVFDARRLPDGRIAVGNSGSSEIRVFDADGKYQMSVGRAGEGPGEFGPFASIYFYAAGDSLIVPDDGFRVHVYGPGVEYLETRRFTLMPEVGRPFLQGVFTDGSWLVQAYENGGTLRGAPGTVIRARFSLLRYGADGRFIDSLATLDARERYVNEVDGVTHYPYIPLSADPLHVVVGDELATLVSDKPELTFLDQSGKVVRLVRWPRERVPSDDVWPAFRDSSIASFANDDELVRRMFSAFFLKELPLPEFAPLYRSMVVDAERRVWLERFQMPGVDALRAWDVIDTNGAWLGVVHVPRNLRVFQVGADFLLGRSLDSLGVERVQIHALRVLESP